MKNIHIKNLDLNLLSLFHVIYLENSLTLAANKLSLSQSAASHALNRLRLYFNDELFVRSSGKMVATNRANDIFPSVKEMMNIIENQLFNETEFNPNNEKRKFNIINSELGEIAILPNLIEAFFKQAPHCSLSTLTIEMENIETALESGQADLLLGRVFEPKRNISQQTLYAHGFVVIACNTHPRIKTELDLEIYQNENHLIANSGSDVYLQKKALLPNGIIRKSNLTIASILALPWLVSQSEMIATIPSYLGVQAKEKFNLKVFELPFDIEPYQIRSYWHPRSNNDAGHKWLRNLLMDSTFTLRQIGRV